MLNPINSLRIPGRLCADPTNLAGAFPHGGTDLGLVSEQRFRLNAERGEVRAEEFGGEATEYVIAGQSPVYAAFLTGLDSNMLAKIFESGFKYPGSNAPGTLGSARGFKLLFSPRDTVNHPGLIVYNAVGLPDVAAELSFATNLDTGLLVVFKGLRSASGNIYQVDKLGALTLNG